MAPCRRRHDKSDGSLPPCPPPLVREAGDKPVGEANTEANIEAAVWTG
jgi:hypothetical protein